MEPQSKKNQVKPGKYGSIMPHTFSLRSHNCQHFSPLVTKGVTTPPRPEIYPKSLSTCYLALWVSKKQQRSGWDYSSFTKGKTFLVSQKANCYLGNFTFYHPSLPLPKKTSSFHFGHPENIHGQLFEKIFLICFSPLSQQAEQKEDDEHLLTISKCM